MTDDKINEATDYITDSCPPNVCIVSTSYDRFHNRIVVAYNGDWPSKEQNALWQEVIDKFGVSLDFHKR